MMSSWNGNTFPRYWPFVRGIHRSPVNYPHKCQWRGALMFSLICVGINGWGYNREAGDLRRHRAHYDVIVMWNGRDICNRNTSDVQSYFLKTIRLEVRKMFHHQLSPGTVIAGQITHVFSSRAWDYISPWWIIKHKLDLACWRALV